MYIYDRQLSGVQFTWDKGLTPLHTVQRHAVNLGQMLGEFGDKTAQPAVRFTVFDLPEAAAKVSGDKALLGELAKLKTNEARALSRAFAAFGKPEQFEETLIAALRAMSLPGEDLKKYSIYLARLGAEAFILGLSVAGDKRFHIGFIDHPSRLHDALTLASQEYFLHFAIRRLLAVSSTASTLTTHRNLLIRGVALFAALQTELGREYRLSGMSETLLLAYRRLLVAVIWKHYQMQMDHLFKKAPDSALKFTNALKDLDDSLRKASLTLVQDEHSTLPVFRTGSGEYRDYFTPSNSTDIGFTYFSKNMRPAIVSEPNISFRTMVRRRVQQKNLLEALQKDSHPRLPPKLHDNAAWQAWIRDMWDGNWRWLPTHKRMAAALKVVEQYFEAFTAHVPHDLREGCKEQNYLTRTFPRAITGSLAHDCAVYALRWIYILGRLITAKAPPAGIKDPKIFLIEMPGHVGVMIRARKLVGDDLLLSLNNKHAKIHDLDRAESDEAAARIVVQDQYQGPKTPFIANRITASPADTRSLWKAVCRIYDKKLRLPYSGAAEPHLRYLAYNTGIARIAREVAHTVGGLWLGLQQKLDAMKNRDGSIPPDRMQQAITQYYRSVEEAAKAASDTYRRDVEPLIDEINNDLRTNQQRLPKGAVIAKTSPRLKPWEQAWLNYRPELEKAVKSRNLSRINPESFFPEEDFVAAVE